MARAETRTPAPMRRVVPLLCTLAAFAAAPAPVAGQASLAPSRHTLSGSRVAVYDIAGTVKLIAGTGSDVVVEVTRRGPDAAKLEVQSGEVRGRQALRVIFPDDRIVYPELGGGSSTTMHVREDGTFSDGNGEGRARRVRIEGDGGGLEAWADITVSVPPGRTFALYLGVGAAEITNVEGDLTIDVGAASVRATGTRGSLNLDTGSGEVTVRDATGSLEIDAGSGGMTLERVRGTSLVLDAGSGGITGSDITVERLSFDLGSGRTRMRNVSARDLELDTGSGGIDLGLTSDVDRLSVESGSGSVTLRLPASLGAELDIDTGSGDIDSEIPLTVTRRERGRLIGRIGDGRGRIEIDAGSGSVRLIRG